MGSICTGTDTIAQGGYPPCRLGRVEVSQMFCRPHGRPHAAHVRASNEATFAARATLAHGTLPPPAHLHGEHCRQATW